MIGAKNAGTLSGLLAERVRRSPSAVAYREFISGEAAWRDRTWHWVARQVARLETALCRTGLEPGDRAAIALPNGTDWIGFDLAAALRGLVVVPLYMRDSPDNQAFVLGHSGARLLVIDTLSRWETLLPHLHQFPELEQVWIGDAAGANPHAQYRPVTQALSQVIPAEPEFVDQVRPDPERLATIIYTSGTTGRPKGVMLTHRAMLWNAEAVSRVIQPYPTDIFLSCLPLAHAFERIVGYYLPMMAGSTVAYARSVETLAEDFGAIHPTAFLGVPRLYERAYAAICGRFGRRVVAQGILRLTVSAGWQRFAATQGLRPRPSPWARLAWPMLDRWVATRVRAAFGGRVRCAVSGGAPLPGEVARFFISMGVPIIEGYGLTEAAPVVAANSLADNMPGSVGRPLPGVVARTTEEGELVVRTPSLMAGYWRDPVLTAETIDQNGWLHTDDIAQVKDGRIYIRGRIKDVLVLATGEKIAPALIEARIARDPLFKQAFVVGERRPYVAAIIVLDRDQWRMVVAHEELKSDDPNIEPASTLLLHRIARQLRDFPRHAQIRELHATFESWTIESGQLTPTLKIKRDQLERRHAADIDRLYAGHPLFGARSR